LGFLLEGLCYLDGMTETGRLLFIVGLLIAGIGVLMWSGIGRGWLGQLPGDINYNKGNVRLHFPIVTCILASLILTVLMWLLRR